MSELLMANGRLFEHTGKVETIEADFDNETGNIAFRAAFANPNGLLRHGETGKILMSVPLRNALIIPQKATFDILDKKSLAGYEVLTEGRGSNAGTCLINLKPWSERDHSVSEIIEELEHKSKGIGAVVEFFEPPAIPGYGAAGGFSLRMLDRTNGTDYHEFDRINREFMDALRRRKELAGLFTFYAANYPQYELVVDNAAAMQKGVSIGKAMENLDILIGSAYEQGFVRFGRFFKVFAQAAPEFRRFPSDVMNLYVKNERDEMVPYSAFMTMRERQGPNEITRYNLYNSSAIRGGPAAGYTSGEAIKAVQEVAARTLPRGYDIAWEGLSFDEAAAC